MVCRGSAKMASDTAQQFLKGKICKQMKHQNNQIKNFTIPFPSQANPAYNKLTKNRSVSQAHGPDTLIFLNLFDRRVAKIKQRRLITTFSGHCHIYIYDKILLKSYSNPVEILLKFHTKSHSTPQRQHVSIDLKPSVNQIKI